MSIKINRWYMDDCTIGRLSYLNFQCFTLELPDKDNKKNVSCIPEGSYNAYKYKSTRGGDVISINDVPERSFIQVHSGNYTRNILGCILVGDSVKFLDSDNVPDITNSRNTLNKLLSLLPDNFIINIE